jgi:hypothetical protein
MKKQSLVVIVLIIFFTLTQISIFAQSKASKIKVTPLKRGKVQLARGAVKSILDLSKDISGCIVTYDPTTPRVRIDTTDFSKVDEAVKGGKTYLLLVSEINSGCKVTGECGAATDLTLVWLKLNSQLKIESKKAVVVQSCFWGDIEFVDDGNDDHFKLDRGKLALQFETNRFKSNLEYSVTTVKYDHAQAERGIVINTEKPARPN